jgi:hypothetical protein
MDCVNIITSPVCRLVAKSADIIFSDLSVMFIDRRPVSVAYRTADDIPGKVATR